MKTRVATKATLSLMLITKAVDFPLHFIAKGFKDA